MRTLAQDLKFAGRTFRSNPGFTLVAAFTLALGIAAATTVFSWIDGLLLRPFPGSSGSDRLAVLETIHSSPNGADQISYLDYKDYSRSLHRVSGIAVHREDVFNLGDEGKPEGVWGELVSGNYFTVLGVKPAAGRLFTEDEWDDRLGAHPVVVISHRLWRTRFREDPRVVGKNIRVNQRQMTIVGVADRDFRGTMPGLAFDLWIPVTMGVELRTIGPSTFTSRSARNLSALVRLADDASVEQAAAEAAACAQRLTTTFPNTNRGVGATVVPAWRARSTSAEFLLAPLRILMAISLVVLAIVCSNVANLLLARSLSRHKELGIRLALGARRSRLIRQLLTETLLLAAAGAGIGIPLSFWMADSLPLLVPSVGVPVVAGFQLNLRVLGFTVAAGALAAVASGIAPALFAFRVDSNEMLKEGARGGSPGLSSHRLRGLLVSCEVALAAVALIGAGLFIRSFENARTLDPGFDRAGVVLGRFFVSASGFTADQLKQFCTRLRDRLSGDPGIVSVSYSDFTPLGSTGGPYREIEPEGYLPPTEGAVTVNRSIVSPGYFRTMGIPLLEGRDFTEQDDVDSPLVLIVNQTFAHRYFNTDHPVGRRVRLSGKWATIVGLAKDSKYFNPTESPRPFFYAPYRQHAGAGVQLYFQVRTAGNPATAIAALRREVMATDPNAGAFFPMRLTEWTEITLLPQKVAASLAAALGIIAVVLAATGLYSVMAYAVVQRTREIGVRMALGARPRDVVAELLLKGLRLTAIGLAAGMALTTVLTPLAGALLVNVGGADPATFAAAAVFLIAVAALAIYAPARRATKVDPMLALRWE